MANPRCAIALARIHLVACRSALFTTASLTLDFERLGLLASSPNTLVVAVSKGI
jgi:hypothetical protein